MSQGERPPGSPSLPPTLSHPMTPNFSRELASGVLDTVSICSGNFSAEPPDVLPTQLDGTCQLSEEHDMPVDVPAGQVTQSSAFGFSDPIPDEVFDAFRFTADDRRDLDTSRLDDVQSQQEESAGGLAPKFTAAKCALSLSVEQPKFFWETDPFLQTIFGCDDLAAPSLKRPALPIDISSSPADTVWGLLAEA